MFINISNHPSSCWEKSQLDAANLYGKIVDMPFPDIPPEVDEAYISALVLRFMQAIVGRYRPERDVLHIMGEMCFSFALVNELRKAGFTCVASTSERKVREENGYKEAYFCFVRFRKYE